MIFINILNLLLIGTVETLTYYGTFKVLNTFNYNFSQITPPHKKSYVVINLVKSFYLCLLVVICFVGLLYDSFNNIDFKIYVGGLYAFTDIIGLIVVEKMQRNTIIHHILVQILYGMCFYYSFDIGNPLIRGIAAYTIFSAMAFSVNTFLALRVFINNDNIEKLANIIGRQYIIICCLNWSYQLYVLTELDYVITLIYASMLSLIIYDDLVLIDYLLKYKSPKRIV